MKKYILIAILFFIPAHCDAIALIGVSATTTEVISAGVNYELPPLTIRSNSSTWAGVSVAFATDEYYQANDLLKPKKDWFGFEPAGKIHLSPNVKREVKVKLKIPKDDSTFEAGNYFCLFEVLDLGEQGTGNRVMSAVGRKMYFEGSGTNKKRSILPAVITRKDKWQEWLRRHQGSASVVSFIGEQGTVLLVILTVSLILLFTILFLKKFKISRK